MWRVGERGNGETILRPAAPGPDSEDHDEPETLRSMDFPDLTSSTTRSSSDCVPGSDSQCMKSSSTLRLDPGKDESINGVPGNPSIVPPFSTSTCSSDMPQIAKTSSPRFECLFISNQDLIRTPPPRLMFDSPVAILAAAGGAVRGWARRGPSRAERTPAQLLLLMVALRVAVAWYAARFASRTPYFEGERTFTDGDGTCVAEPGWAQAALGFPTGPCACVPCQVPLPLHL